MMNTKTVHFFSKNAKSLVDDLAKTLAKNVLVCESIEDISSGLKLGSIEKIIIDFDLQDPTHIDLIQYLNENKFEKKYVFLSDVKINRSAAFDDDSFRQRTQESINKIINFPGGQFKNFSTVPYVKSLNPEIMVSHVEDSFVYITSRTELKLGPISLKIEINTKGKPEQFDCSGNIEETTAFDQDEDQKYYYVLDLDKKSFALFLEYHAVKDEVINAVNFWVDHAKDE